jgi:hypothetical protein
MLRFKEWDMAGFFPKRTSRGAMTLAVTKACKLLGVGFEYTATDVREAFVRVVKEAHPDAEGVNTVDLQKVRKAKELLLRELEAWHKHQMI